MRDDAITTAEYEKLTPKEQGFVTYMQAEWNPSVPKQNFYVKGSPEHSQFEEGLQEAVLVAQDLEE